MIISEFWASQALVKSLYSQCIESVCEKHGLTRMELDILLFLANNPQFDTASDIVERRHLAKSHVSTSIKSLEQKGFLTKSHTASNRKTIHLTIGAAASHAISDGQAAQDDFIAILFRGFTEKDRRKLQDTLLKISENVSDYLHNVSK